MARTEITRRVLLKGLIGATILVAVRPLVPFASASPVREIAFKLHNVEILPEEFNFGYLLRGLAIPEDKSIGPCYFSCAYNGRDNISSVLENAKKMVKVHLESKVRDRLDYR